VVNISGQTLNVVATSGVGTTQTPLVVHGTTLTAATQTGGAFITAVGNLGVKLDVQGGGAKLHTQGSGDLTVLSGTVVTGTLDVTVDSGRLSLQDTQVSESVKATVTVGDLSVDGALSAQGGGVTFQTPSGGVTLNDTVNSGGNVDVQSRDSVALGADGNINNTSSGTGGASDLKLTLGSSNVDKPIVIGDTSVAQSGDWTLGANELGKLKEGFGEVVIGGSGYRAPITIAGETTAVVFKDPVRIETAGQAVIKGDFSAQSLTVGNNTTLVVGNATQNTATTITVAPGSGVVLGDGVQLSLSGRVVLEAASLSVGAGTALTGAAGTNLQIKGVGTQGIELGGAGSGNGALSIGQDVLATVSRDVTLTIGSGAQSVTVNTDLAFNQSVTIDATALNMGNGTALRVNGNVTLNSTSGMALGQIEAIGGTVTIEDTGSQVSRVGNSVIQADTVVFSGWGPAVGLSDQPLVVEAPNVKVYSPDGLVLRSTNSDGSTSFSVVNGSQMQRQLTNTYSLSTIKLAGAVTTAPAQAATPLAKVSPSSVYHANNLYAAVVQKVAMHQLQSQAFMVDWSSAAGNQALTTTGTMDLGGMAQVVSLPSASPAALATPSVTQSATMQPASVVLTNQNGGQSTVDQWSDALYL